MLCRDGMSFLCTLPRNHVLECLYTPLRQLKPSNSARPKIDAVRSYGAEITFCEPNAPARAATLATVQQRTGAVFVPPYDAVNTILGQGTAMLELLEQVPEPLAAVIAPVGGESRVSAGGVDVGVATRGVAGDGTPDGSDAVAIGDDSAGADTSPSQSTLRSAIR